MSSNTKVCTDCGQEKPTTDFQRHYMTADGFMSICKVCNGKRASAGMKKNSSAERSSDVATSINSISVSPTKKKKHSRQPTLIEPLPNPNRIAWAWLPDRLKTRAREFEAAGELSRWGHEVRYLNDDIECPDKDLEIRPWGSARDKWFSIQVCGEASVSRAMQTLRAGRCDAVMYLIEDTETWEIKLNGKEFPKIKIQM